MTAINKLPILIPDWRNNSIFFAKAKSILFGVAPMTENHEGRRSLTLFFGGALIGLCLMYILSTLDVLLSL
jgi:hypothetical protein